MHATVRSVVEAASGSAGEVLVLDIEASLEHFCQNKAIHADTMLIVVEPYFRSLETGRRMVELARQLEPERLALIANKVRDDRDVRVVRELATLVGVEMAGAIPYDERLLDAERAGAAPLDFDPETPAVVAIDELARRLLEADPA
jgi:CO dehydrogenase maturation factor